MQDRIRRFNHGSILDLIPAGIEVAIKPRKVAAAYLDSNHVALQENIACRPHIDLIAIRLSGTDRFRLAPRISIASTQDPLCQILLKSIRPHID